MESAKQQKQREKVLVGSIVTVYMGMASFSYIAAAVFQSPSQTAKTLALFAATMFGLCTIVEAMMLQHDKDLLRRIEEKESTPQG